MKLTTGVGLRAVVAPVALMAGLLAGCGEGGGDEPAGLDAAETEPAEDATADDAETPDEASEAPASEPTAEPTAERTPTEHVFPDAGVTVVEPVPASQAEAAALATYVEFVRQWRKSLRDVKLSETLRGLAAAPVIDEINSSLEYQEEHGIRYSGEAVFSPTVEQSRDNIVLLSGCADASKLTIVDDGEERPIDGADTHPHIPMQVVVANDGAGWMINENTLREGESC